MTSKTTVAPGSSFAVPAGISMLRAIARGAAAVPNFYAAAARGAIVQSMLSVAPGQVLPVTSIPGGTGGLGNGAGGGSGGNGGDGINIAGLVFGGGAGGNGGTMAPRTGTGNPYGDALGGDAGMPAGAAGTQLSAGSSEYPLVDPGKGANGATGGAGGTGPGNPGAAGADHASGGAGGNGGAGTLGTTDAPGGFSNYQGAPGGGAGGGGYAGGGAAAGSKYSGGSSAGGAGGSSMGDEFVGYNASTVADAQFVTAGAPKQPTLTYPTGNTLVASTRKFSFQLGHNPDTPGDTLDAQTNLDIRYQLIGAGSWTTLTGLGAVQAFEVAAGTLATGAYEWQARTYSDGIAGAWSSSEYFTVAVPPPAPVVTSPTSSATVNVASVPVTWTASGQVQSQAQLLGDKAGVADEGVIYSDTGVVTSSAGSAILAAGTNHVAAHVRVRIRTTVDGLWSAWADIPVSIEWAGPPKPRVTLATDWRIFVTVTNPPPVGVEPVADRIEVYVIEGDMRERRAILAPGDGWIYETPPSGVEVGIEAVAIYTPTNVQTSSGVTY